MGTYSQASRRHHRRMETDTYIPPYSILHRTTQSSSLQSSASSISELPARRRGPSSEESVKLLDRLASRTPPSQSNSSFSETSSRPDYPHSERSSRTRTLSYELDTRLVAKSYSREPKCHQHISFRAHRWLNKGFQRVSPVRTLSPRKHEEKRVISPAHVSTRGAGESSLGVKSDSHVPSLAERLSAPPLSARIAPNASTHVSSPAQRDQGVSPREKIEHNYASQTNNAMLEDGTLEEGEVQEDLEAGDEEVPNPDSEMARQVIVRHLELGTSAEDVAAVFERFGKIIKSYAIPCGITIKACDEAEDILVEFAELSSAAQAIEDMKFYATTRVNFWDAEWTPTV